jgi:hypothetical protein
MVKFKDVSLLCPYAFFWTEDSFALQGKETQRLVEDEILDTDALARFFLQ